MGLSTWKVTPCRTCCAKNGRLGTPASAWKLATVEASEEAIYNSLCRAETVTSKGQTIEALPLAALGVDVVVDCTGVFKTAAKVAPYYAAGVARVIVSAPVKDGGALNLVYGINHHLYDGTQPLITGASCTT